MWLLHTQPLELTLSASSKLVSLDQHVEETETYYKLLQEQIQHLSESTNHTEEANQLRDTAKNMLEALQQCIDIIKDSQLSETEDMNASHEASPAPEDSNKSVSGELAVQNASLPTIDHSHNPETASQVR